MSITFTTWDILREFYHTDISKGVPGNPETDKMYYKDNQYFWLPFGFYFQIHRNNSLSRLDSATVFLHVLPFILLCHQMYVTQTFSTVLYNQIDSLFNVFPIWLLFRGVNLNTFIINQINVGWEWSLQINIYYNRSP